MVSADKFWQHPALKSMEVSSGDERPLDELFDAAVTVRCAEAEKNAVLVVHEDGSTSSEKEVGLADKVGVLFTPNKAIAVIKVLSHDKVAQIVPAMMLDARMLDRKAEAVAAVKVVPMLDVQAAMRNLTNAQLIDIQMKVKEGNMTIEEALASAKEKDQLTSNSALAEETLVCVCLKDVELNTIRIEVLSFSAPTVAKRLVSRLNAAGKQAKQSMEDPFRPSDAEVLPLMEGVIGEAELDRNRITAIKMVGQGEFGEVFLATHAIPVDEVAAGDPLRDGASIEFGELQVQVAVKTVKPTTGPNGVKEFVAEAGLQFELQHVNIASLVGVCFIQKPFLAILEYIMYGDLKKVLETFQEKGLKLEPVEQLYVVCEPHEPPLTKLCCVCGLVAVGLFRAWLRLACSMPGCGWRVRFSSTLVIRPLSITHTLVASSSLLSHAPPPPRVCRYVAQQMAAGLGFVASKKIVHLDMAARNCLVHSKTCVKIADFGLSRRYTKPDGYHMAGKMKIPFLWCPPECLPRQVWNKNFKFRPVFNQQSDIWAFGVVCWEVASYGQAPYGAKTKLIQMLQKIDNGLRLQWPACAPELKDVRVRCVP